ncbi:MAG: phosphatase PAP2 family protein, partial [Candidatus Eiseniibacteriota bacterium]
AIQGATFGNPKSLRTAKELGLAMAGSTAVGWSIKVVSQRERPDGSDNYSFPSGHSAVAFSAATVLDRRYGGMVGWAAYGAAALVAESRVADDHHYLSDVVTGAIIGRLIGRFVTRHP